MRIFQTINNGIGRQKVGAGNFVGRTERGLVLCGSPFNAKSVRL